MLFLLFLLGFGVFLGLGFLFFGGFLVGFFHFFVYSFFLHVQHFFSKYNYDLMQEERMNGDGLNSQPWLGICIPCLPIAMPVGIRTRIHSSGVRLLVSQNLKDMIHAATHDSFF